jgi:competence protein ComEA
LPSALPSASAGAPAEAITADGKVILNRAGLAELRRIPGVGEKRAAAILELRARLGRFRKATDLLRVRGLGTRSLARMREHFVLDAPEAAPSSVQR